MLETQRTQQVANDVWNLSRDMACTKLEQGFFHEFAFDNKAHKTNVEFRIWWKCSKFERRRIRIRTSSHP